MRNEDTIEEVRAELQSGMQLSKCRKCGCMQGTLDSLATMLPMLDIAEVRILAADVETWAGDMERVRYDCLGCAYCYPAVAQNILTGAFPSASVGSGLGCDYQISEDDWPRVLGEYFVINRNAPIAVSTLASTHLAEALAARNPEGLAIIGKTETENIGIDKVVKNIITNPAIRYLIVTGKDPAGHQSGKTLLALGENGIDAEGRVIGAPGRHSVLRNVTAAEVQAFRKQVQVIDRIGCDSPDEVSSQVEELARHVSVGCGCNEGSEPLVHSSISMPPTILATESGQAVKMDKAGYFVILPRVDRDIINVEHYAYDNTLLRIIEGEDARTIYRAIVAGGWVTELSHAAYLGKELANAELSLRLGIRYVQDGA